MKKALRIGIVLALAGASTQVTAQMGVEDEEIGSFSAGNQGDEGGGQSSGLVVRGGLRERSAPDIYTVRRGDTLWDITGHFFGNPWEWPRVWSYNPEITNPHWIYPDDRVRLREGATVDALATEGTPSQRVERPTAGPPGSVFLRNEGFLDREALEQSGVIVGSPEESMMLSPLDDVYVEFEDPNDAVDGQEYAIYREMRPDERERLGEGVLVRIYGTLRLRTYDRDRNVGRAVILDAVDPIERGFRLAHIPRRFEMVAPQPNDTDLEAKVVATLHPVVMSADRQIIFIDVGSEQGVRPGNRFFVVEEGDDWRENRLAPSAEYGETEHDAPGPDEYPPEIQAEARVVSVRPNTSALMITRAVGEVEIGDRVEMRRGF